MFLAAIPGEVVIFVGYASVAAIAWLAREALDRKVTQLVGDMRGSIIERAKDENRDAARRFLAADDIEVLCWYRSARSGQGGAEAHLKVWATRDPEGQLDRFLVGSANLTATGLDANAGAMAVACGADTESLRSQLLWLTERAWEAKKKLTDLVLGREHMRAAAGSSHAGATEGAAGKGLVYGPQGALLLANAALRVSQQMPAGQAAAGLSVSRFLPPDRDARGEFVASSERLQVGGEHASQGTQRVERQWG